MNNYDLHKVFKFIIYRGIKEALRWCFFNLILFITKTMIGFVIPLKTTGLSG